MHDFCHGWVLLFFCYFSMATFNSNNYKNLTKSVTIHFFLKNNFSSYFINWLDEFYSCKQKKLKTINCLIPIKRL